MTFDEAFWAPRLCLLLPIPELDIAADLLDQAANFLLQRELDQARSVIRQADMPEVWAFTTSVIGPENDQILRRRGRPGIATCQSCDPKVKTRKPPPKLEAEIFRRDGWRCRYCSCRVVLPRAFIRIAKLMPDAICVSGKNIELHATVLALKAVVDHVVPHSLGGTNHPSNLVTACQACNYGKYDWTLDQLGLIDPRGRDPIIDNWDGLQRLLDIHGRP